MSEISGGVAPDAVVTDGWLDQLIALADSGLAIEGVGAMSNDVLPCREIGAAPYADAAGLDAFAAQWRLTRLGSWFEVEELSSPCL